MKMRVFRLRERGERLPGEEVERRGPAEGELLFRQRVLRSRIFKAMLVRPRDLENFYVVPLLDRAVIVHINADGMLISGVEVIVTGVRKHQTHEYRQSWWCVAPGSRQGGLTLLPQPNQDAHAGVDDSGLADVAPPE